MNEIGMHLLWLAGQVSVLVGATAAAYFVVRRGNPTAGASTVFCGLVLAAGLSAAVFSPWPQWSLQTTAASAVEGVAETSSAAERQSVERPATSGHADAAGDGSAAWLLDRMRLMSATWQELTVTEVAPASEPVAASLRWAGWIAWLVVAIAGIGGLRLVIGLLSIRRYRRGSVPVEDAGMHELLDVLLSRLSCQRQVELRECGELTTAATIGWRPAIILLPSGWRDWSANERRSVLAHELAHICRNDYLHWLLAQAGVLLHFYHPAVHWLARRLRLEQELAADALAASVSGGARPYLSTLAELALRQDDQAVSWPARAFLPTRGTLLRRIEMLRDAKSRAGSGSALIRRGLAGAGLLATAVLIAGLREPAADDQPAPRRVAQGSQPVGNVTAPGTEVALLQADGAAASAPAESGFSLKHVPTTTTLFFGIRPAKVAADPAFAPMAAVVNQGLADQLGGLTLQQLDQVAMFQFTAPESDETGRGQPLIMISAAAALDFTAIRKTIAGTVEDRKHGEATYQVATPGNRAYYRPDDKTLIIGMEPELQSLIDAQRVPAGPFWQQQFSDVADGEVCLMLDMASLRSDISREMKGAAEPMLSAVAPLWQETDLVGTEISLGATTEFRVVGWCSGQAGATTVRNTVEGLIPLTRNMLGGLRNDIAKMPPPAQGAVISLMGFANGLLDDLEVKQDGRKVIATASSESGTMPVMIGLMLPAVQSAREAARRAQGSNNLKQIAVALHNYHDVYGHFPPPVLVSEDGKTTHSWRVAILPFLEQAELYDAYQLDEPWDSPANKQVLKNMPQVFRSPNDGSNKPNSSYFAVVGKDTAFGPAKSEGIQIRQITDGTSNTAMVVESREDIPWTKPEDIALPEDGALPKLGGLHGGGFNVAFADGSVRFIAEAIDPDVLLWLLQRNDGNPVNVPLRR